MARESVNQIARKFDEIVEFSGCARYIDTPVTQAAWQPLGRLPQGSPKGEMSGSERINLYSSGMYVRLAFAVAAHLEPEPRRWARRDRLPQAGPQGFANRVESKPNFDCGRGGARPRAGDGRSEIADQAFSERRGIPKKCLGKIRFEIETNQRY